MYKQAPKSPAMKALVGNQKNLPAGLKAQIEAAPESPAKNMNKGYGSPAKQNKNIKHMGTRGCKSSPFKLKDACYHKVKAQYDVFPSAYASGAIAKCRKKKGKK